MDTGCPMRRIVHPGRPAARRIDVLAASVAQRTLQLEPGRSLLAALSHALAPFQVSGAVLTLHGGSLFPFAHVLPALARTPEHAVYFSDRFDATAPVQLNTAVVTWGRRDQQPWLHTHARWATADGSPGVGHVLPEETVVAAAVTATAWLLAGAGFEVVADEETRFSLFSPRMTQPAVPAMASLREARPALLVRLSPNEDVCLALERICRDHGISHASVRGGVGSTVGAVFDDGRRIEPFVTETLVRQGRIRPGADGRPRAEIDVDLVDYTGAQATGRLARGANPVLVTFELVLEPEAACSDGLTGSRWKATARRPRSPCPPAAPPCSR